MRRNVFLSARRQGKQERMRAEVQRAVDEGKRVFIAEDRQQAEEWFKAVIPWWRRWWIVAVATPVFRWRVRHVRVGQEVMAVVGMKSGWGEVQSILTEGGRRWGYTIVFPPQPYPQSMFVANGTYCVPLEHVVELDRGEDEVSVETAS